MFSKNLMLLICLGFFMGNASLAQDFEYTGVAKCKICHNTTKSGKQYTKWKEAPHSKAYESLKSEKAMAIAKEKGIAVPAKDPKCLKCHSTTGSVDKSLLTETIKVSEGVSCESCHGPGSVYKNMKIMKDHKLCLGNGLIVPDEKLCKKCHNAESPTFKSFNFEEAKAKIAHPTPEPE